MRKQIRISLAVLCAAGCLGLIGCSDSTMELKDEEYAAAMEPMYTRLSQERVPWTTAEGYDTDISTRAFKFALFDINPGKLPDVVVLKDSGKNLADDGIYILGSCYSDDIFQVMEMWGFVGYYPKTGIYVLANEDIDSEENSVFYDWKGERHKGRAESYYYLADCSQKELDDLFDGESYFWVGSHYAIEGQGEDSYIWYERGTSDDQNKEAGERYVEVSEKEFETRLAEYVGNTKMVKVSREDFLDNTEENRNKYLK